MHAIDDVLPSGELEFPGHVLQLVPPIIDEYVPDAQLMHNEFPVIILNFPVTQDVQAPPSGPVYPALHLQSEIDFVDMENGANVFAGHDTHLSPTEVI